MENYNQNGSIQNFLDIFFLYKFFRAGRIRFSGTQKSVLLKVSSGERCASCNFVLLVTLGGTHVCLIVYIVAHQMK